MTKPHKESSRYKVKDPPSEASKRSRGTPLVRVKG